ncbi:MAG: tyrosine-protein phosphatase [Dehalococcoidia bacterium]|nr:tyrosine-protein phosphatase [Dehalococcoidia bacterium]
MRQRVCRITGLAFGAILLLALFAVVDQRSVSRASGPPDAAIQPSDQAATLAAADSLQQEQPQAPDEAGLPTADAKATAAAPWTPSPFSGPIANPPIENFGVVEQGILYRSAQPSESQYRWMLSQGFKSIVSFRRETGSQADQVLGDGFQNYLWISIEDETNPTDAQAAEFLAFVTDSRNWPVLIHCKVGLGRTGTLAALVRYAVDGWSMDEAIQEAKLYRGGVDLVPSQTAWLLDWAARYAPGTYRSVAS